MTLKEAYDTKSPNTSYDEDVALGKVEGRSNLTLSASSEFLGTNPAIAWGVDEIYNFNFANSVESYEAVSTSANDALGSSGLEKLQVIAIGDNGLEISTIVDMNGTTPVSVNLTNPVFINELITTQIGTDGGAALGVVVVQLAGGGEVKAAITPLMNVSRDGVFKVPSDEKWIVLNVYSPTKKGSDADFLVEITNGDDGIFRPLPQVATYQNTVVVPPSTITVEPSSFIRITGMSDNPDTQSSITLGIRRAKI